ncbi:MetQ/NlpA family ABC transporter substrate-binding protein [Alkalibacterium sp. 20]|uniref:MetQ/NlpA family ABC transporter substrate-binding protein n=1 Tax=Alkalibacterium sp. 20 TaxID=1798803 RepID=UPI0008FFF9BA|nr:MetQ/NlpA family ABC transporter substrate-binding protein [Alkalibacterium sp. 20]OJF93756.1 methionine ABC transporter substrate-binding protein [Alkalibacterium sp. 20]
MNKIKGLVILSSALLLAACGNGEEESVEESQTLTVGATNVPHAEILEFAKPLLAEEGIELTIETYNDYVIPNLALSDGDLDANYFQHVPYFEGQVAENDYDFVNAGGIHLEPLGAYSNRYDDLSDLPEGATVLTSNSVADHGRVLSVLVDAGLIEVDDSIELVDASFDDITANDLDLQFEYEYDAALLPTLYAEDEGDLFFINSNFAVDQGISPVDDAIALENTSSPYANIIAVRSEDENDERIAKLVEVLRSEETQDFILETWDGAVLPVDE